jgi:zinc transporter ZupT
MLAGGALSHTFSHFLARHTAPVVGFSGGALLALAFLHLLPEAGELAGSSTYAVVLLGVIVFYIVENFLYLHACPEHLGHHQCQRHILAPLTALGLGLHSVFDGVIIVLAMLTGHALGWLAALGIVLHRLPSGAVLHSVICTTGRRHAFAYVAVVAAASLLALIILPFSETITDRMIGFGLAFSAGNLLYITLSDLLPQSHRRGYANLLALLAGIAAIWLLGAFFELH